MAESHSDRVPTDITATLWKRYALIRHRWEPRGAYVQIFRQLQGCSKPGGCSHEWISQNPAVMDGETGNRVKTGADLPASSPELKGIRAPTRRKSCILWALLDSFRELTKWQRTLKLWLKDIHQIFLKGKKQISETEIRWGSAALSLAGKNNALATLSLRW